MTIPSADRASLGHLDRRLAQLRDSVVDALPPATTDDAIAAAIAHATRQPAQAGIAARGGGARIGARDARTPSDRWLAWPLALAASIAVLSFIVRTVPPSAIVAEPMAMVSDADAFLPVVPLADIERAGDTMVVSARVPRTTLAAMGLPIDPARAAEAVDTELLVRGDGSVLAVRFVF